LLLDDEAARHVDPRVLVEPCALELDFGIDDR
jgi:hypothetical protein